MWASARDTHEWAHKSGASWPCSELSGHRFVAEFDGGGLVDFSLDGRDADVSADELSAIVSDLATEAGLDPENVAWDVAVEQFITEEED